MLLYNLMYYTMVNIIYDTYSKIMFPQASGQKQHGRTRGPGRADCGAGALQSLL